jgi:hypothetical protein
VSALQQASTGGSRSEPIELSKIILPEGFSSGIDLSRVRGRFHQEVWEK